MKRLQEYVALADEEYPLTIYCDHNLADHLERLNLLLVRYKVRECTFDSIKKNQTQPKELPGLAFGDVYVIKAVLGAEPRSAMVLVRELASNFQPGWQFSVEIGEGKTAKKADQNKGEAFTGTVPGSLKADNAQDGSVLYGRSRIEAAMKEAEARAKAKASKKTVVKFMAAHDTLAEMGIVRRRGVYLCEHDGQDLKVVEMVGPDFDRSGIEFAASPTEIQALIPPPAPATFDEYDIPMDPHTALLAVLANAGLQVSADDIYSDGDTVKIALSCGESVNVQQMVQLSVEAPDWTIEVTSTTGTETDNGAGCVLLVFTRVQAPAAIELPATDLSDWDDHVPAGAVDFASIGGQ